MRLLITWLEHLKWKHPSKLNRVHTFQTKRGLIKISRERQAMRQPRSIFVFFNLCSKD